MKCVRERSATWRFKPGRRAVVSILVSLIPPVRLGCWQNSQTGFTRPEKRALIVGTAGELQIRRKFQKNSGKFSKTGKYRTKAASSCRSGSPNTSPPREQVDGRNGAEWPQKRMPQCHPTKNPAFAVWSIIVVRSSDKSFEIIAVAEAIQIRRAFDEFQHARI